MESSLEWFLSFGPGRGISRFGFVNVVFEHVLCVVVLISLSGFQLGMSVGLVGLFLVFG